MDLLNGDTGDVGHLARLQSKYASENETEKLMLGLGVTEVQLQNWHTDFSEASEVDGCEFLAE